MEDAIVAQVEWYMGRLNLASDHYLKDRMDHDLWVDLDVILDFPKMIRMGVRDKTKVAALLNARSSIVEVDVKTARIRPAWARRSTLFLHDIPPGTRVDDVFALFQSPASPSEDPNSPSPVSQVPGLLSVQPASDTVWLAVFDSPTGAQAALSGVMEKTLNGAKVRPEVHVETPLRPAQQQPPPRDAAAYVRAPSAQGQMAPTGVYVGPRAIPATAPEGAAAAAPQPSPGNAGMSAVSAPLGYAPMMGPMGMPVPVLHHPPEGMHPQYAYAPPAGYMPHGYAPHNVGVARQFIGPRGMANAPANYMMAYPQSGHPFDPTAMGVAPQAHGVQPVQQPMDGAPAPGTPVMGAAGMSEGGRSGEMPQGQAMSVPGGNAAGAGRGENGVGIQDGREVVGVEYAQEKVAGYPSMAGTGQMQIPMVGAQAMDPSQMMGMQMREVGGKAPLDPHYMHRGAIVADPNAVGLGPSVAGAGYVPYSRGAGRGQHPHQGGLHRGDRNGQRISGESGRGAPRGPVGNAMDGTGRGQANRKGKKGNRNSNGRHAHGHGDRHGDGRIDGKADGSGSPSNREDRRPRDEKPKSEPNLNSMHFPPLPMANDTPGARAGQPSPMVLRSKDGKDGKSATTSDGKLENADANGVCADTNAAAVETSNWKADCHDAASLDTNTSAVTEARDAVAESASNEAEKKDCAGVTGDSSPVPTEDAAKDASKAPSDKKSVERSTSPGHSNGSAMSYAAILRSKKPTPVRPANPMQRGVSDSSTKSGDTNGSSDSSGGASGNTGKDRNPRRRKAINARNAQSGDALKDSEAGAAASTGGEKSISKLSNSPVGNVNARDQDNVKSKVVPEASRPHSVWANKPKSLFQAAGATPVVRPTTSTSTSEIRKAISPVPSQEGDGGRDKADAPNRMLDVNGQADFASVESQGTAFTDASTNGDDLPDVNQLSFGKSTPAAPGQSDGDSAKVGIGEKVMNGNQATPKGAWALGGPKPKPRPKNTGNGVMEKSSGISDS